MQDSPVIASIPFIYSAVAMAIGIIGYLGVRRYAPPTLAWTRQFGARHKRVLLVWAIGSVLLGIALRTLQIMAIVRASSAH